ncbi:MAG: M13 family metallopeptidase [Bacteroidales bacterium]|nr:M13 family metallopeptidase [Bacteroidales bacterium]
MKYKFMIAAAVMGISLAACDNIENNVEKTDDIMTEPIEKGIELSNLDTTTKAGDNFFQYSNGGWLDANPIPDEYSRYGAFAILGKKNQKEIKSIIEDLSSLDKVEKGSPEQQIRDFYNAGMDTSRIEELGYEPLKERLNEISNISSVQDVIDMQAKLNMEGTYPIFAIFSSQDDKNSTNVIANMVQAGLGLPDRDYYTNDDERSKSIRTAYVAHCEKMFQLIGNSPEIASQKATVVMNIESQLANASMTMLERRDPNATYNIYDREKLKALFGAYDIDKYLADLQINDIKTVNVRQPKFFENIGVMMSNTSVDDWKTYLEWNLVNSNASALSSDFVNQNFAFYSTTLSGVDVMRPRWKRIISSTNGNLGDPVGKMYVERYFPAESKKRMMELVGNLRIALKESIANLDWMSEETKLKAEDKLASINVKIGYPDKWIDYSSVDITANNYMQNLWNTSTFSYKRNLNKIGKPVDRDEWGMTPQTVNAYYSPNMNEIVFPAAILQPPFFSMDADDAVNYGAIGVVIGHEMTHGFDDQGRLYDKDGNLNDWWNDQDAEKFKAKTKILVDQYNNFAILDSLHVDGDLTLGENIADNGGLFIAYTALLKSYEKNGKPEDIDGLNFNQRYCISYAQLWRQHIRPKALIRNLQEDVHSPGLARVNAGIANTPWWYEAFNVQEGDANYIAPENRAKIW